MITIQKEKQCDEILLSSCHLWCAIKTELCKEFKIEKFQEKQRLQQVQTMAVRANILLSNISIQKMSFYASLNMH